MNKNDLTPRVKRLPITIGIPAYNEEGNIASLLTAILRQTQLSFFIKEIIIASDGSSDETVSQAKSLKNKRIIVIAGKSRKGKMFRFKQIAQAMTTDVLVQLDADIHLHHPLTLEYLVKPFTKKPAPDLVCGDHFPLAPKTTVQKLGIIGSEIWKDAKKHLGKKAERYYCVGHIRAFSKKYLEAFPYNDKHGSIEDVYSYYFAKTHNFSVVIAKQALVHYTLPRTFSDYFKQMRRFVHTTENISSYFPKEVVKKHETITTSIKLQSLARITNIDNIIFVMGYIILHLFPKIAAYNYNNKSRWDVAETTKRNRLKIFFSLTNAIGFVKLIFNNLIDLSSNI